MNKSVLRYTVIAFLFVSLPEVRGDIRLALVPESDAGKPAADLLTVALSTQAQVRLVERAELDRVMSEQALAGGGNEHSNSARFGRGRGVVTGGSRGWHEPSFGSPTHGGEARCGAAPDFVAWPPADLQSWSTELAQQLKPLWPKLAVLKKMRSRSRS